jgi:DNA-binding MarR family transcriptional regulator
MVLWKEGEQKVSDICSRLDIDVGTISPLLKRMEKNNLITRSRDNIDERIVKISLTHKGEELKEKAKSIPLSLISCFSNDSSFSDKKSMESIVNMFDSLIDTVQLCNK